MVQLVRRGNGMNALAPNSFINRVEFATIHDIFVTLIWRVPLSAAAAPFVPRVVPVVIKPSADPMAEVQEVTDVIEDQDEDEDEEDESNEVAVIAADRNAETAPEVEILTVVTLTAEMIFHVTKIQKRYKAIARKKAALARIPEWRKDMNFSLSRIFDNCLEMSTSREWDSPRRKMVYLGPLPHILLCIERISKKLEADRKRWKDMIKGVTKESHLEYDEIMDRMTHSRLVFFYSETHVIDTHTRTSKRRKRLGVLHRLFDPKSDWHVKRSFEELQTKLREVEKLGIELKLTSDAIFEESWSLAEKAILQERKEDVQREQTKPSLNTEDIYDFEEY